MAEITETCTCKHEQIPKGASIEYYVCSECGGIAKGWYTGQNYL